MQRLSEKTWKIIRKMFPAKQHQEVSQLLLKECGNNLPWFATTDEVGLERVRFAVLKVSKGRLDVLRWEVQGAQKDWRDTLMGAGFADNVMQHNQWADEYLS